MQNFTNESHIFCHLLLRTKKNFRICHVNDLWKMTQLSAKTEVWEFVLWQTEEKQAMPIQTLLQQRLRSHHSSGPLAGRPIIDRVIPLQRGVNSFVEDTEFQCGNNTPILKSPMERGTCFTTEGSRTERAECAGSQSNLLLPLRIISALTFWTWICCCSMNALCL